MLPRRHALKIVLGALAAVLAAVIGTELAMGPDATPGDAPRGAVASLAEAKLLPPLALAPPEQAYPETGARPLFVPGRRPAPAGAGPGSMVKGQYALHGVTIVDGLAIAMLKDKASGKTLRLEKGKDLNGLRLTAVQPDRVTLAQGDDSEELVLTIQKGASPMAAAIPAGPFAVPAAPAPAATPGATAVGAPATVPPTGSPMPAAGSAVGSAVARPAVAATPAPSPSAQVEELLARSRARRAARQQQAAEQQSQPQTQNVQK